MIDDVILNKCAAIEKCIQRIHQEYHGFENEIETNHTKQDSILLNLQRACEAAIDLGTYIIRIKKLGVPQSSRDIFVKLSEDKIISSEISEHLQAMVGFRNIAVHNYQKLNLTIVRSIIDNHLEDFASFTKVILKHFK